MQLVSENDIFSSEPYTLVNVLQMHLINENDFWFQCTDFSHVESLIYIDVNHELWDYLLYKAVIKKNYILSKNGNLLKLAHTK